MRVLDPLQPLLDPAGQDALMSIDEINQSFFVEDLHALGVAVFSIHGKQKNLISTRGQLFELAAIERGIARLDLRIGLVASVSCHGNEFIGLGIQLIRAGIDQIVFLEL